MSCNIFEIENLYKDSIFLKTLFEDKIPTLDNIKILCPNIKNFNKILEFYSEKNLNFSTQDIIFLLEDLNYLNCSRLIDMLIIAKHKYYYRNILNFGIRNSLSNHVKTKYDILQIESNILESCVRYNCHKIFKHYIKKCIDINNILYFIIKYDNFECFHLTLKTNKIISKNMIISGIWSNINIIDEILKYDSSIILNYLILIEKNEPMRYCYTPIFRGMLRDACYSNKPKIVKILLDRLIKNKSKYVEGEKLLHGAIRNNSPEIVKILLDYDLIAIYKNNDLSDIKYALNISPFEIKKIILDHPLLKTSIKEKKHRDINYTIY